MAKTPVCIPLIKLPPKRFNLSKILLYRSNRNYGKFVKRILLVFVSAIALLVMAFYFVLTQSGKWLVHEDDFNHVSWVVILDGQSADMERSDYAKELIASGKADSVMILGRRVLRDRSNADFYADDLGQSLSLDSNAVFLVRHNDPSTIGEARTIIPWLKNRNADTVLLLTSAAATQRVSNIFKALSGNSPVFLTTDIHHYLYDARTWYTNRESRKVWLREWAARINSNFDLFNQDTLTVADSSYYTPIRSLKEEKLISPDLQKLLKQAQVATQEMLQNKKDSVSVDSSKVKKTETSAKTADSKKSETDKKTTDTKKNEADKKSADTKKNEADKKPADTKKDAANSKTSSDKKDNSKK